jgi:hypothetical protein
MKNNGVVNGVAAKPTAMELQTLRCEVEEIVRSTPVIDIHTHLFAPEFGDMNLFGIDELLTYHYLVAEMFRAARISPDRFWRMSKAEQAELVWQSLFVEKLPISEAARGVVTVLSALGIDSSRTNLSEIRDFFKTQNVGGHIDRILELANVGAIVMTNDPFDTAEMEVWEGKPDIDSRFHASLRMDRLLNNWRQTAERLEGAGFGVDIHMSGDTTAEIRRYLDMCIEQMKPLYMAVSLPDDFQYPTGDVRNRLINEIIFPTAREHKLPFTLMVGVRRGVNPALRSAGDGVGRADVAAVERMCMENPDISFLATFLSRENQHELCVAARKFSNLMPFGCWWFLNNPSIVAEITTERLELLGSTFIPQHSDARVLEQLIYKWQHSKRVIADCLYSSYEQLVFAGRMATRHEIQRDVRKMFSGNFHAWVGLPAGISDDASGFDYENGEDVSSYPIPSDPVADLQ